VGTLSTHLVAGSLAAEKMLHTQMENTIVLLEGALIAVNETNRFAVNMIKCLRLNLATLSQETLYLLQDGIMVELHARESRAIQVLNKQKINME